MKRINLGIMIIVMGVILGSVGALLATQTSDRIESSAKKSYIFKTYLKSDDIAIKVTKDSIVTLTGSVSEWSHLSLAEETVAGLPGVKRVNNSLTVKGEQPEKNSDAWLRMQVKVLLMFHRNVSGLETYVDVKNGAVTLSGKAANMAQIELTTEYVNDIDGVKSVKNNMTVEKQEKSIVDKVEESIDDASINAQVKLALLFHRSTSIIKISVETRAGIVTVRGVAKNNAEKDLVGKLVNDIKGVKGLKNEITIGQLSLK